MEAQLATRVGAVRATVERLNQQLAYESSTITRLGGRIKQLEDEKAQLVKAIGLIDRCIQLISANGIGKIESIVSDGLRRVFDDPTLTLVVDKKPAARGNIYKLLVRQGEGEPYDPMNSYGGGVVNLIGFLLRLILVKRFKLAKLLVLDEQFNNVSAEYLPMVSELLHTLTENYGYTIFAITHQPILAQKADRVYNLIADVGRFPHLEDVTSERSVTQEDQAQIA